MHLTPLSQLNTDYKILAKCIANRLKKVLPGMIHCDQPGFLPKRFIGENINRIMGLIHYSMSHNINSCLVAEDFEKAFDLLEQSFALESLNMLNSALLYKNGSNFLQ